MWPPLTLPTNLVWFWETVAMLLGGSINLKSLPCTYLSPSPFPRLEIYNIAIWSRCQIQLSSQQVFITLFVWLSPLTVIWSFSFPIYLTRSPDKFRLPKLIPHINRSIYRHPHLPFTSFTASQKQSLPVLVMNTNSSTHAFKYILLCLFLDINSSVIPSLLYSSTSPPLLAQVYHRYTTGGFGLNSSSATF